MPPRRSSTRISSASTRSKAKVSTPEKPNHKRQISSNSIVASTGSTSRSSKRTKAVEVQQSHTASSKSTPKKSQYFKSAKDAKDDDDDESASEEDEVEDLDDDESGYEEPTSENLSETSEVEDDVDDDDDASDSAAEGRRKPKPKKKATNTTPKGVVATTLAKGKELWREGVKVGLGPGKQVFIEKPKPRGDGGIKYANDRIHPNTYAFLGDLKANNDREWFKMHQPDYKASKDDWETFVEALTEKIMEKDETIPELPPKDLVFRIFRDVRFSSDKTPYKPNFSAAWSRTGRKGPYAAYYVQIGPNNSFVGSGLWNPDAAPLALLRQSVDRAPQRLKHVLMNPLIRKEILGGVKNDEEKAVQMFVGQNSENALKTKPKDFDADHRDIALLRLRSYTIGRRLKDEEVIGATGLDRVAALIGAMVPFVTFLNSVVMPDEEEEDDEDSSQAGQNLDEGESSS